jgi:hypothetical protein
MHVTEKPPPQKVRSFFRNERHNLLTIKNYLPRYNTNPILIINDNSHENKQPNDENACEIHAPTEIQVVQCLIKPAFSSRVKGES